MLKETPLLNKCLSHFNSRCRAPEDNKRPGISLTICDIYI